MTNTCTGRNPAAEFWDFAVAVYARDGVSEQLLQWQDTHGANVNLSLVCVWSGQHGRRLSTAQLRTAQAAVAGWHAAVTRPLREIRRRLKGDWRALAIDAEGPRQAILAAELEAEKAEQALLLDALSPWPGPSIGAEPGIPEANLRAYLGSAATAAPASIMAAICSPV